MFTVVEAQIVWHYQPAAQHAKAKGCVLARISHVSGITLLILALIPLQHPLAIAQATALHVVLFMIVKIWAWIVNGTLTLVLVCIICIV